jgi:hypothetical protein
MQGNCVRRVASLAVVVDPALSLVRGRLRTISSAIVATHPMDCLEPYQDAKEH